MSEDKPHVAKEKKVKTKEKAKRSGRKHSSLKVWSYYEVKDGKLERKRDHCPRCGPGTFLSEHKNRHYCGRCGFTQIEKKPAGEGASPEKGPDAPEKAEGKTEQNEQKDEEVNPSQEA